MNEVEALKAAAEGGMLPLATAEELMARAEKLPMSSKVAEALGETVEAAQVPLCLHSDSIVFLHANLFFVLFDFSFFQKKIKRTAAGQE